MNWDASDFDWNQARAFLATAEEGSLSAAARVLGSTQPTLSRQVSVLEDKLGVTLFERGPRTMALTQAGFELLEHVKAMHEAAIRVSLSASGQSQTIAGHVRLATTNIMATHHLPKILRQLRIEAPDLTLEIKTSNQLQDLIHREADIAIRHARPTQAELIAKQVHVTQARFYANREWLTEKGPFLRLDDLHETAFIGFETPETLIPTLKAQGLTLARHHFPLTTDSTSAALEMVRAGLGLCLLLPEDAAFYPDLQPISIEGFEPFDVPYWLVTHRELKTSRRIRLVYDVLDKMLCNLKSGPR